MWAQWLIVGLVAASLVLSSLTAWNTHTWNGDVHVNIYMHEATPEPSQPHLLRSD